MLLLVQCCGYVEVVDVVVEVEVLVDGVGEFWVGLVVFICMVLLRELVFMFGVRVLIIDSDCISSVGSMLRVIVWWSFFGVGIRVLLMVMVLRFGLPIVTGKQIGRAHV